MLENDSLLLEEAGFSVDAILAKNCTRPEVDVLLRGLLLTFGRHEQEYGKHEFGWFGYDYISEALLNDGVVDLARRQVGCDPDFRKTHTEYFVTAIVQVNEFFRIWALPWSIGQEQNEGFPVSFRLKYLSDSPNT